MRITFKLDDTVFRQLKRLQKEQGKPLGRLVTDLLAEALRERRPKAPGAHPFRWFSQPMGARVDLGDHAAILELLDRGGPDSSTQA